MVISKPGSQDLTKECDALIDTGATHTFVSQKVIDELGLDVHTSASGTMEDASNNENKVTIYVANILLENHSQSVKTPVGSFKGKKECDVIIGMDIIQHGQLFIGGNKLNFVIKGLQ